MTAHTITPAALRAHAVELRATASSCDGHRARQLLEDAEELDAAAQRLEELEILYRSTVAAGERADEAEDVLVAELRGQIAAADAERDVTLGRLDEARRQREDAERERDELRATLARCEEENRTERARTEQAREERHVLQNRVHDLEAICAEESRSLARARARLAAAERVIEESLEAGALRKEPPR